MLLHGNRSLLLVAVTGFIIGLVFTLQSRPTLQVWRRVVDAIHGEYFDNSK
jgi:ABC-type transporter Mla maintaining outer membrane lipid asymmetry permease subunit MlaE